MLSDWGACAASLCLVPKAPGKEAGCKQRFAAQLPVGSALNPAPEGGALERSTLARRWRAGYSVAYPAWRSQTRLMPGCLLSGRWAESTAWI